MDAVMTSIQEIKELHTGIHKFCWVYRKFEKDLGNTVTIGKGSITHMILFQALLLGMKDLS